MACDLTMTLDMVEYCGERFFFPCPSQRQLHFLVYEK